MPSDLRKRDWPRRAFSIASEIVEDYLRTFRESFSLVNRVSRVCLISAEPGDPVRTHASRSTTPHGTRLMRRTVQPGAAQWRGSRSPGSGRTDTVASTCKRKPSPKCTALNESMAPIGNWQDRHVDGRLRAMCPSWSTDERESARALCFVCGGYGDPRKVAEVVKPCDVSREFIQDETTRINASRFY